MTDQPKDHAACERHIRNFFAHEGIEVVVSTHHPLVINAYTEPGMTCPHGTTFWMEPTTDQIAQWAKDGVR